MANQAAKERTIHFVLSGWMLCVGLLIGLTAGVLIGATEQCDQGAERRAQGWEKIARDQSAAMGNLMNADAKLKAESDKLLDAMKRAGIPP
jgi:hypothetical protein